MGSWTGTIAAIITLGLKLATSWLERQRKEDLIELGQTREIARASQRLLDTLKRKNAVDDAIFGDSDPDWADRLRSDILGP